MTATPGVTDPVPLIDQARSYEDPLLHELADALVAALAERDEARQAVTDASRLAREERVRKMDALLARDRLAAALERARPLYRESELSTSGFPTHQSWVISDYERREALAATEDGN